LESSDNLALPKGVYTLEDLKIYGKRNTLCPYFLARRFLKQADVVIYTYHYLLDPKIAQMVSKEISKDAIIVFDEAHNIDNVCIDSMSIDITKPLLDSSVKSLNSLSDIVTRYYFLYLLYLFLTHILPDARRIKETGKERLEDEYKKLVEGLKEARLNRSEEMFLSNPVLPDDILEEAVPGNIRKAEHFIYFLRRFIEYLKNRLRAMHVVSETPLSFLVSLKESTYIEQKPLRYCTHTLTAVFIDLLISLFVDSALKGFPR
jgi:DNA excision repair protein ERCC-2